jgi:uncharacterized protein YecE (DUF72 family)
MATRYHIGAKQLQGDIAAYAKRFDLLEVPILGAAAKSGVSIATLKRWRKAAPPHFEFTAVAGPHVARLVHGDAFDVELTALLAAVDVLQARTILIPTPMEVTPSKVWRDRMERLLDRLPRDATQVAWDPRGVWEIEDAAVAARKWGIVLVVDATRDPIPAGPVVYTHLRALGETRSYGAAALERVVHAIGERREAYVILETPTALAECKRLRSLAQGVGKKKLGGAGRILRPRVALRPGAVRVKDDEQE